MSEIARRVVKSAKSIGGPINITIILCTFSKNFKIWKQVENLEYSFLNDIRYLFGLFKIVSTLPNQAKFI